MLKIRLRLTILCKLSLVGIILFVSCAGRGAVERYRPVMGYWRTERNIIMSIHMSPENGVAAVIKMTPGILSEESKPGTAVITQIKPLVEGGFTGSFIMPGEQRPVRVRMVLSSPETLVIMSWDRRVKGNIMKWQRVTDY